MIQIRKSEDRGHAQHGWLDSHHTFSFSDYHDPKFMGFRDLRVINEDRVAAGQGFGTHPHRDMEILSYVLDGELEHKDSMGTGSVIRPGDVQRMSAGTGVRHSEFNHSKDRPVHFFQIWILPEQEGARPCYEQKHFERDRKLNRLTLVASRDGREGSVTIHQDVELYASVLEAGKELKHPLHADRYGWVQVARGEIELNGQKLSAGDGAAITRETELSLRAQQDAEFILLDLA